MIRRRYPCCFRFGVTAQSACLLAVCNLPAAHGDPPPAGSPLEATEVRSLCAGVKEIAAPGIPGPLLVFGERAFPVVLGRVSKDASAPVVAAARWGKGGVAAFGHTGYGDADALKSADTRQMLRNAIRWAADVGGSSRKTVRVIACDADWAAAISGDGIEARHVRSEDIPGGLASADVVCMSQGDLREKQTPALTKYVKSGGGLVAFGLGWGWLQLNPGKTLNDHPGNRLLAPAGIAWADGYLERTGTHGYRVNAQPIIMTHARHAIDALAQAESATAFEPDAALMQASWTAMLAARHLPRDDKELRPRLTAMLRSHKGDLVPTEKSPITSRKPLARFLIALQVEELSQLPAAQVKPHPAARDFPGDVPSGSVQVRTTIDVDAGIPRWHGTGLYAAAGQSITVELPKEATTGNLRVRIGAHQDELWHADKWTRVPEITRSWPLSEPKVRVASAFGGPIYIEVPDRCAISRASVTISGAVEAPRYVLGQTRPDDWRKKIRQRPGPWAELETKKIIITIPSGAIRNIDDPEPLLRWWDSVLDAHAALATIPPERKSPERFVADRQISAGYMHSGYPIMTHLDVAEHYVDLPRLIGGDAWGFFHELGHNHQSDSWTFDGTGEVTCNLFTLHALDTVCKLDPGKKGHDAVDTPPSVSKYVADGAKFDQWKRDPFLALQMYIQLRDAFGWDTYKKVFAEYRRLPDSERPRNDQDKRDQWMIRFSRACGKNLGPFFRTWGVPTSDKARDSISDLPQWMPPEWN